MAQEKGGGSTRNDRNSESKCLGVRVHGGQAINAGGTIVCRRGTRAHAGVNVGMGRDHVPFALADSHVKFTTRGEGRKQFVDVVPAA